MIARARHCLPDKMWGPLLHDNDESPLETRSYIPTSPVSLEQLCPFAQKQKMKKIVFIAIFYFRDIFYFAIKM